MHGYPETTVLRHLMGRPAGTLREGRSTSAPAGASFAVVAIVTAFLLVVGLGFAFTSLQAGNDSTTRAACTVKVAGHGATKCR